MTAFLVIVGLLAAAWLNHELTQYEKRRRAAIDMHIHEISDSL